MKTTIYDTKKYNHPVPLLSPLSWNYVLVVSPFDANGKVRLNTAHPYLSGGISSSIVLVAAITLKKRIREPKEKYGLAGAQSFPLNIFPRK